MSIYFVKNVEGFQPKGAHVGRVCAGVSGTEELMQALEAALRLPASFRRTWDALSGSLRDLSWLPAGRITLVHEELPLLSPEDLSTYLHGLEESAGIWRGRTDYALDIVFAKKHRHRVLAPLADIRPRSPWRRLKAELDSSSIRDEFQFISQKFDGFEFVMNIVEHRDGSTRQIRNALYLAFRMRGWDRERFARALPSLCIHESLELREQATWSLLVLRSHNRTIPGELIPNDDVSSCVKRLHKAIELGVQENLEALAHKYLAGTF
ncbi:barstar family protein [Myxococcus sp. K38C18041901]|uniref:barstar family protein n=1 Tax=Myxococcus guangdongensis TaxID=2906760 RepID=UPI0020A80A9B|nr:barstar family protein [Myxococcus guangdongensis]MCP3059600.1 barstar family protein [Myxococcus guangdongensis]